MFFIYNDINNNKEQNPNAFSLCETEDNTEIINMGKSTSK